MTKIKELNKNATWDEVFAYALTKYNGNEDRALKFTRGWFTVGDKNGDINIGQN